MSATSFNMYKALSLEWCMIPSFITIKSVWYPSQNSFISKGYPIPPTLPYLPQKHNILYSNQHIIRDFLPYPSTKYSYISLFFFFFFLQNISTRCSNFEP